MSNAATAEAHDAYPAGRLALLVCLCVSRFEQLCVVNLAALLSLAIHNPATSAQFMMLSMRQDKAVTPTFALLKELLVTSS
jgi:hypothetical protein